VEAQGYTLRIMPGLCSAGLLVLALAWSCVSSAGAQTGTAPQTYTAPTSSGRLCACQQEGQFLQCFVEIIAECEAAGAYAATLPMCRADWSQGPGILKTNSRVFIEVIKASAVKCRHPYTFSIDEQASFLGATVLGWGKSHHTTATVLSPLRVEAGLHCLTVPLSIAYLSPSHPSYFPERVSGAAFGYLGLREQPA